MQNHAQNHLPFTHLRCDDWLSKSGEKRVKTQHFSALFLSASMDIYRIANRRMRGECVHDSTSLSLGAINIQILDSAEGFDGVPRQP